MGLRSSVVTSFSSLGKVGAALLLSVSPEDGVGSDDEVLESVLELEQTAGSGCVDSTVFTSLSSSAACFVFSSAARGSGNASSPKSVTTFSAAFR